MMEESVRNEIETAVASALTGYDRVILAVSGGRDSMVMLAAAAAVCHSRIIAVATFDHGTGKAATAAADLVQRHARHLGFSVVRDCAAGAVRGEAAWRAARWHFLRTAAASHDALVATAHTADDQIETVFMRVLRNAGARGIAGLYANSGILRPLLSVRRTEVARYATETGMSWVEDPSNVSMDHLRNRVRRDLLPSLNRVQPGFSDALLGIARRAADLRQELNHFVDRAVVFSAGRGGMVIPREVLVVYDVEQLELLWPVLAARIGVILDRRGTRRLSAFTIHGAAGTRIQLSGGYEVVLHKGTVCLRRSGNSRSARGNIASNALPLGESVDLGKWRICRRHGKENAGSWMAELPDDSPLAVRSWQPGDRMVPRGAVSSRRVKGLLRDAGIDAGRRVGWPVVLSGVEIVWIPGVRVGGVATIRPGIVYECEYVGG
ncbi:MAG: tRNA lysidine(34) synthetase TilS [Anaerolineae bacterium]|nr:tRNA lysidine(34) synthetase TilS [Gemmatimonadaceae bacterium]